MAASASRSSGMALVGLDRSAPGRHLLTGPATRVGSDSANDLIIEVPSVSRHHALIRRRLGRYVVRDAGSTNGTFLNGQRIKRAATIRAGDELRFGTVRFAVLDKRSIGGAGRSRRRLSIAAAIFLLLGAFSFAVMEYCVSTGIIARLQNVSPLGRWSKKAPASAQKATASGAVAVPGSTTPATASPWLARLNFYRAMAKVAPVSEDPKLSEGDQAHARYLVKSFGDAIRGGSPLGAEMHAEKRDSPWYSEAGAAAAKSSDVAQWYGEGGVKFSAATAVDGWIAIPFHRLPLLSPGLKRAGYGQYCESGVCAAALNVLSGTARGGPLPVRYGTPIAFPPDSAALSLLDSQGEWPDPLSSCPGFTAPAGLPITLQFGPWMTPKLTSFSIARNGAELPVCGFDATGYANPRAAEQELGRGVLRDYGAVVIIPQLPLVQGATYTVTMVVDGKTYRWSFEGR